MNNLNASNSPLTYPDWLKTVGYNSNVTQEAYFSYLVDWYKKNNKYDKFKSEEKSKREEYIKLIKSLIYLFNKDERNLFLSDIDYNNDEDLIYIIPYIANKLKQITQSISEKREDIKDTKEKNKLVGSSLGIEKILYSHILKNFTNKSYHWNRIPISPLGNHFPQLSSINEDFYIELEELYDTNNYHDSDPSVPIENYFDLNQSSYNDPFSNLTNDELTGIITSRLLERVAETPLSKVFNSYLNSIEDSENQLSDTYKSYTASVYNQIAATKKYLGESVYGLTAIRDNEINAADYMLSLNFEKGNNWFYWPSGSNGGVETFIGNIFKPIPINESNLVLNRTVSGSNYMDSDLLFVEKDNQLEGAWLQGHRREVINDTMSVALKTNDKTSFIFPWVGFEINSKNLGFKNYNLNDSNKRIYQSLSPEIKDTLIKQYYNNSLPNSAVYDIYLNQTNLVDCGAHSGFLSDEADSLTVSPSSYEFLVWNDSVMGNIEEAYLYKFIKTDIYIGSGMSDIQWPIQSFQGNVESVTLTLSTDTCNPLVLGSLEPKNTMVGCVAGLTFDSSDVIYKLLDNGGTPTEAAWLGAGSISQLNQTKNAIQIYDTVASNCSNYLDGPIQPALYMRMETGKFNSFIWMDEDTPADDVFNYHEHEINCEYANSYPHNFYKNQDYQNPSPLNEGKNFPLKDKPCTCKAVNYSPIGSEGQFPKQYNSMCDLLFADPQGLGDDFSYSSWKDTRNFTPSNSPQFSFFKIDGKKDKDVGFGQGTWTTGNGKKMILKTGRRYSYYRSNLRINSNSITESPYLLVKYPYKNISLTCGPNYNNSVDLVILIDNSRTQYFDIEMVKNMAKTVCENAIKTNPNTQISIISFSKRGLLLSYLTDDLQQLLQSIDGITVPIKYPDWLTNITDGLILANNILYTTQPPGNECSFGDISKLCYNLKSQVINQSKISTITNCPRSDSAKSILLFSDGQETVNEGTAETYAEIIKKNGATITCIDIGYYALTDKLMKKMASDDLFFNLQEYLLYTDIDLNTFIQNITTLLMGCFPALPLWCKAKRNSVGAWVGLHVPSDMILAPGDYLSYVHRNSVTYNPQDTYTSFTIPSLSFTINVKLDGWDYYTNTYNISSRGYKYGAKPFWGKTNAPAASALPFGGGARIMDEYVVLHQPVISDIILKNGNFINYKNNGKLFRWDQDLKFTVTYTDQRWNKLIVKKSDSILSDVLNTRNIKDYVITSTNEPSDIFLESYSTLNPSKYTFHVGPLNDAFNYTENLYNINRCRTSFVVFTSGEAIKASYPYLNLDNIHYPTIANIGFPSTFITESKTGNYLLPDRLGVSNYRGLGYDIELDPKSISNLDALNLEYMFLDINKYGSRNRGLTKKDQISPVQIKNIDNKWMIQPYGSGNFSGTIIETVKNQKLIPYQSNYEINNNKQLGISLQKDGISFWGTEYYEKWNYLKSFPLTFRNEFILENFLNKTDSLLTDLGTQSVWKTDIYGNNFGLIKGYGEETSRFILSEDGYAFITEYGLKLETE